jgi:thioredoxin-like negative regulator of GroEL
VVAEFVGAQAPSAVATFLDEVSGPSAAERLLAELEAEGELPEVVEAVRAGELERALELLLVAIDASVGDVERRNRLRDVMVALFRELGQEHPLSLRYRRRLASALY